MQPSINSLPFNIADIPDFIQKKAEEELYETNEQKAKCLKALQILLAEENCLNANMDNRFLLRFLRAKKFNLQKAFSLIKKYYGHRQKYTHLYEDYLPSSLCHVKDSNIMTFLPYRTPNGCAIWVSRFGSWDPSVSTYEENLKFGLMCMELAVQYECTQISGVVNILDLKNLSYRHLLELTPKRLKCFISGVQDCFPLRQKATHVVYEPSLFTFMFRLISPLLSEKSRTRIYLHGHDMKSLHQHIPPEILPETYGGQLGPFQNDTFYEALLKFEDKLKVNQSYGYK